MWMMTATALEIFQFVYQIKSLAIVVVVVVVATHCILILLIISFSKSNISPLISLRPVSFLQQTKIIYLHILLKVRTLPNEMQMRLIYYSDIVVAAVSLFIVAQTTTYTHHVPFVHQQYDEGTTTARYKRMQNVPTGHTKCYE